MAEYLRYVIKNIEPLRIADDSKSQKGQTTTLCCIPGSTIRGLIINALSKKDDFNVKKKALFSSDVRYLNAYPLCGEKELIPSPKGFYENKKQVEGKKEISNVVIDGDFSEGQKRASLGRFCYLEEDCIYYYNVETDSDMRIKINLEKGEKKNVFRNEYMVPNQEFVGYIAVENESLKEEIKEVFSNQIILGNGRSAGMGKCQVVSCAYTEQLPYGEYREEKDVQGSCYMMLLSNMVMRNEAGEYCGIYIKKLEKLLGIEQLEVEVCSTSTVNVKGFNRIWGVKIPSVVMYEQGSVFHLKFQGTLKAEKMAEVMQNGIGVRKNEGFGRVLFLKNYETVKFKLAGMQVKQEEQTDVEKHREDEKVLRIVAKEYYKQLISEGIDRYVLKKPLEKVNLNNSKLGMIEAFTTAYQYESEKGWDSIEEYLKHTNDKDERNSTQKPRNDVQRIIKVVNKIYHANIEELLEIKTKEQDCIMGISKKEIFSEEEILKIKLKIVTMLIRQDNKKEGKANGSNS